MHSESSIDVKTDEALIEFIISADLPDKLVIDDGVKTIIEQLRDQNANEKFVFQDLSHENTKQAYDSEKIFAPETANQLKAFKSKPEKKRPRIEKSIFNLAMSALICVTLCFTAFVLFPSPYSYAVTVLVIVVFSYTIVRDHKNNVRFSIKPKNRKPV